MTRENPTAADQYDFTDVAPFAALPDAPQPSHEQPRQAAQPVQQVQPAQPVQPTQAEPQTEVIKAQSPGASTPGFALGAPAGGSTAADVGGATAQARSQAPQTPQQQERYESTPYGTQLGGATRNEEQRYESNPYGGGSYEQRAEQRPALGGAGAERSRVQDTPEPRRVPQTTARDSEAYGEAYGEPYGDAQQRQRSEARTGAEGKQGGSKSGLVILAAICVVLLMIFVLGLLILLNVVPFPGL
ncbi:hypothetical protein [Corynebacterium sp. Marseille-P3884]|uniref:hypothetical protein n=1 Tax=Corynebacterium sp. Marseille-P3884 TaxID=2495409 RepID=UPI001B3226D4|nr:hypothetical protein [Corynebacterium sp. Marseille-P3884]MBP3949088.1 hypothetical protein [Corynebacterium sp. Marseille-P3884]